MGLNPADLRGDAPDSTMVREAPLEGNDAGAQELGSSAWRGDGSLARGSGYPVKRFPHTDNQKTDSNGLHSDSNSMQSGWRSKSHLFKSKGEKGLTGEVLGRFGERRPLAEQLLFGAHVRFVPSKLEERFMSHRSIDELREQMRNPNRPPQLAIVSPNLEKEPSSLMLITITKGLQVLGYHLQVYAFEEGPLHSVWEEMGCHVSLLDLNSTKGFTVDWSNFEGVIVTSIEAKKAISSLMQEPFSLVPVIWIIQEDTLGKRLRLYTSNGWKHIISEWQHTFQRADVVVFPDYTLAMMYSQLDTGNFFVIPGSPHDAWVAERFSALHGKEELRMSLGLNKEDLVVLVVGSPFFYSGLWWEHTMAIQALQPIALKFIKHHHKSFKLVILSRNSTGGYAIALQAIASHLNFPDGVVQHYSMDDDVNAMLRIADIVLYGSVREEQAFPPILIRAMSFGLPVVAPNLTIIEKHIVDGEHGLIFPSGNIKLMTRTVSRAISNGKLSHLARKIASSGQVHAKDLLASESVLGYANLLEKVLQFPSESMLPKPISSIPEKVKNGWQWDLFIEPKSVKDDQVAGNIFAGMDQPTNSSIVFSIEDLLKSRPVSIDSSQYQTMTTKDEIPGPVDWEVQKSMEIVEETERREEDELEERMETLRGTWEDVYRNARKAERIKFEINERDEGELERTGQSLCIYELYYGSGTWPFLHTGALYRGLSLSVGGRRVAADDLEAAYRLLLLNDSYYKDVLCEIGGLFAIANRIDNIHKNPWIGFQSWRATGRKVSLSTEAENILAEAVQSESNEDTMYFWARMDRDTKNGIQGTGHEDNNDFWSFCDRVNSGKCRVVFENAFRKMYDLPSNRTVLPPMPHDGDSWSVLHSWALPTPSFLEFVMFSRMFVDALDAQLYEKHHENGTCILGTSRREEKHCYCRLLELLVNIWAYHSSRKMIYLDPQTGLMQEQHSLADRRGHMWEKYFNFTLLKTMDEDLAEEADDDHPNKRWIWPLTGEVYWQGIYEREREERYRLKMEKKRKSKEKLLERLRSGYKQKSLGRVQRPPSDINATDH
ncbi:hypothetical protein SUGI_0049490 [Cryptomeria japonica]|nr:hypothetical protein SUGI_0049490 [Cryptomeria japonica]